MRRRPHGCRGALCLHVPPPDPDSGLTPDALARCGVQPWARCRARCWRRSICSPSADLVAAGLACHADDDCPCGAHCTLGRCAADCQTALDCDAGYCDTFGAAARPTTPRSSRPSSRRRNRPPPAIARALAPGLLDAGAIGASTTTSPARAACALAPMWAWGSAARTPTTPVPMPTAATTAGSARATPEPWRASPSIRPPPSTAGRRTVMLYVDDQVRASASPARIWPRPRQLPRRAPGRLLRRHHPPLDQGVSTDPAGVPSISADSDGGDPFTVPPSALVIPIQAQVDGPSGSLLLALSGPDAAVRTAGDGSARSRGATPACWRFPTTSSCLGTLISARRRGRPTSRSSCMPSPLPSASGPAA